MGRAADCRDKSPRYGKVPIGQLCCSAAPQFYASSVGFIPLCCACASLERAMAGKPITRDQFEIGVRGITHKPTGATFTPRPGSPLSGTLNKSQLGNMSKPADDYSPFEVEEMMEQLWAEYVRGNR